MILLALSLITSYEEVRKSLVELLASVGLLIAVLAAIGHIYGVPLLYGFEARNAMAFVTSITLMLIGCGILFAVAQGGWMGVVLRVDAAGLLARSIFLFSFLAVPLIGWIAVFTESRKILSAAFGTSILVVTVLLIITTTVFRSASEIRRLERERRTAEDQLRQAEKLAVTGRLAATLAHEVNNPLEAVTNILYLLDHDPGLAAQSRQFLTMAQEELSRVSHITRQTLAFYREPVSPAVIRPADLVRQTVAMFEPKLLAKNLHLSVLDLMQGEVTFFPGEFKQIVTNLLSNAMDASARGGTIALRVRATHSWMGRGERGFRVTVSDNGSGIDQDHRPKLFQPFFTTKGQKGTGLGLWVTLGLVQKHGGHLRMRTSTKAAHRGTTFSFFLPAEVRKTTETQVTTAS
jgi:signal transduction histidine kinase